MVASLISPNASAPASPPLSPSAWDGGPNLEPSHHQAAQVFRAYDVSGSGRLKPRSFTASLMEMALHHGMGEQEVFEVGGEGGRVWWQAGPISTGPETWVYVYEEVTCVGTRRCCAQPTPAARLRACGVDCRLPERP